MKRTKTPQASRPAAPSKLRRLRSLDRQLSKFVPACPWAQRNPIDCPLYGLRRQKSATISKWIDGLSIDEKEYLVLYHQCCLATKQESAVPRTVRSRLKSVSKP